MPKAFSTNNGLKIDTVPFAKTDATKQYKRHVNSPEKAAAVAKTETSTTKLVQILNSPYDRAVREEKPGYDQVFAENRALLSARVESSSVPHECLVRAEAQIEELKEALNYQKRLLNRTLELVAERQDRIMSVIPKLFGYTMSILPNGNCIVAPAITRHVEDDGDVQGNEMELIWDTATNGFTEISSAPLQSNNDETKDQLYEYWIKSRRDVAGFLATLHLESQDQVYESDA